MQFCSSLRSGATSSPSAALVDARQALERQLDVASLRHVLPRLFQRFFQVNTGSAAEYHQIQQRVAAQTVGTVHRYASHFAYSEQTFDDLVVTVAS